MEQELGLKLAPLENRAGAGTLWGGLTAGTGAFLLAAVLSRDGFVALAAALVGLVPGVLLDYVIYLITSPRLRPA